MGDDKRDLVETHHLSEDELAEIQARLHTAATDAQFSLLIFDPDGVRAIPLVEGRAITVGRYPPADVSVRDSSLSRQHACVELNDGKVWVDDLDSTNGTWVNGARIEEHAQIEPGADLTFGAVSATVHAAGDHSASDLESHDHFRIDAEAEVNRAKTFRRNVALLMVQGPAGTAPSVSRWLAGVRAQLRPFDRSALYSADSVEVLLPELGGEEAAEIAQRIAATERSLRIGLAVFPQDVCCADDLFEKARCALTCTSAAKPVQTCVPPDKELDLGGPVVASKAMSEVLATAEQVASSPIPVLILGETGCGKEIVARAIHERGSRREGPLVPVNCGGIPRQLVESHLFGHEKGAFTGAGERARGVFEAANGGTVFLDEVGELPAPAQVALLRVLESKKLTRVGSTQETEVDVRVIAATHRDLEAMVGAGEFREDLLYRLNAMTIAVPPLRERVDDIVPLARRFLRQANRTNNVNNDIDEHALALLARYDWPGNVRELRNVMDRAVVIAQDQTITIDDLPTRMRDAPIVPVAPPSSPTINGELNLRAELDRVERELIEAALVRHDWDRAAAAKALGLPLRTLARKIQTHGIAKS